MKPTFETIPLHVLVTATGGVDDAAPGDSTPAQPRDTRKRDSYTTGGTIGGSGPFTTGGTIGGSGPFNPGGTIGGEGPFTTGGGF